MKRIYVPTTGPLSWRPLLAQPDRQWKAGFSAMSVAQSWEAAAGKLPTEIGGLLERSPGPVFDGLELLIAIPTRSRRLRATKSLGMRDKAGQSGTNGCASGTNISCPPSFCSRT